MREWTTDGAYSWLAALSAPPIVGGHGDDCSGVILTDLRGPTRSSVRYRATRRAPELAASEAGGTERSPDRAAALPVVTAQHQRLLRAAGQATRRFAQAAAPLVVEPSIRPATIFQHCHWRKCTKFVLAANGGVIPGKKVGRYYYPPHATQHANVLRKDNARRTKKQMNRAKPPAGC
jgi:hypothetical protein